MNCPKCHTRKTRVRSTMASGGNVYRQRQCEKCATTWSTHEAVMENSITPGDGEPIAAGYGPNWALIRERILERDSWECRSCGAGGVPLDVHHRVPLREHATHEVANAEENLVSLCKSCHRKADRRYRKTGEACAP